MAYLRNERKRAIEKEARAAALFEVQPRDGCPYPFASEEGAHWVAVWWVASLGLAEEMLDGVKQAQLPE